MKPKLLVTLGCSLTQGVGCYDIATIPPKYLKQGRNNSMDGVDFPKLFNLNRDRFHDLGWPNKLGKLLNYNKVINLGYSGASTSGNLKVFTEKFIYKDLSNYDVLIIWMLPSANRISFYSGSRVINRIPSSDLDDISNSYINFIEHDVIDSALEQIFYMKCMEHICENKGYKILFGFTNYEFEEAVKHYYKSNNYISDSVSNYFHYGDLFDEYSSPICYHPNELGYGVTADRIYDDLKNNYPLLLNKNKVDNFEWEYDGFEIHHMEFQKWWDER